MSAVRQSRPCLTEPAFVTLRSWNRTLSASDSRTNAPEGQMRFPSVLRSLADLKPETLAVMHGSSYHGECDGLLNGLAGVIKETFDH